MIKKGFIYRSVKYNSTSNIHLNIRKASEIAHLIKHSNQNDDLFCVYLPTQQLTGCSQIYQDSKNESQWSQNKIYNNNSTHASNKTSYHKFGTHKKSSNIEEVFLSAIEMPKESCCAPYQQYFQSLKAHIEPFQTFLKHDSSLTCQIRKGMKQIEIKVNQQLKESQDLLKKEITRFRNMIKVSCKQHVKISKNARDKISDSKQFHEDFDLKLQDISLALRKMDDDYNS